MTRSEIRTRHLKVTSFILYSDNTCEKNNLIFAFVQLDTFEFFALYEEIKLIIVIIIISCGSFSVL